MREGQTFPSVWPRGPGIVVLRVQIVEFTPDIVLLGQGLPAIGCGPGHFLAGGACKEVTLVLQLMAGLVC
jgi:hypothetical protein